MITAEEARELQKKNYEENKVESINKILSIINNLIKEQSYKRSNYIRYTISREDPFEEVKEYLTKLGYYVTYPEEEDDYNDMTKITYKICW